MNLLQSLSAIINQILSVKCFGRIEADIDVVYIYVIQKNKIIMTKSSYKNVYAIHKKVFTSISLK